MRPLRFTINVTPDGCIDHEAVPADAITHQYAEQLLIDADAIIFGRLTYELMESAWRAPAETGVMPDWMDAYMMPFARTMHAAKKYVASRTLQSVDWNAELLIGDLKTAILALKQQPGKGLFVCGIQLAQSLAELDLIDEYEFIVHPRVVGRGPSLFAGLSRHIDLQLVSQQPFPSGAIALRYTPKAK